MSVVERADRVGTCCAQLENAVARDDVLAAMRHLAAVNYALVDLAEALVEQGVTEGMTPAAMARALNVPASTLRGARREFAR